MVEQSDRIERTQRRENERRKRGSDRILSTECMSEPPPLLSLAIDSAILNFSNIYDLSFLPEHILLELFWRTLRAGKLNERILKLFVDTGKEEILSTIQALNIQVVLPPVLPTRCSEKF